MAIPEGWNFSGPATFQPPTATVLQFLDRQHSNISTVLQFSASFQAPIDQASHFVHGEYIIFVSCYKVPCSWEGSFLGSVIDEAEEEAGWLTPGKRNNW